MALIERGRVCVTGAAGFIGSWLVNLLLTKGYVVHATVREPGDEKNAHLWTLDKAAENLKLFKADLLNYESLLSAFEGCIGVFHLASPVPSSSLSDPEREMVEPAVKGTFNVLKACTEAKVKRLVVVSSIAAVVRNPAWPKGQVRDETCWSDTDYCRKTEAWYFLSKTEAERLALDYAEKTGLDVITVCPPIVYGPVLQSTLNASSLIIIQLLKGTFCIEHVERSVVDVRDLAEALVLVFEKAEAKGRYLCTSYKLEVQEMAKKFKEIYPKYVYSDPTRLDGQFAPIPKLYRFEEGEIEGGFSSEKLQRLGWTYRPLEEILVDMIESYKQSGFISD